MKTVSRRKTVQARRRAGEWAERYIASGGEVGSSDDLVRVTVEYPRGLLRIAREAAADQRERFRDLATRALAEEVRRLALAYRPSKSLVAAVAPERPERSRAPQASAGASDHRRRTT